VLARRGAQVLAGRGGPDDLPRSAELYADAGDQRAAAGLLLSLARDDLRRGALRSAEHLLARADATGERRAEVTAERIGVLGMTGQIDEAFALGEAALPGLRGDTHAEVCLALARAAVVGGRWAAADSYVERAGRPDDPRSLVLLADAAFGAGRAAAAAELAAAAVARAEEQGAPIALCEALGVAVRAARRADTAPALLRRAAQVAAEHGLTPWRVDALTQLGIIESLDTEHPESLHHARRQAHDAGMVVHTVSIDLVLADHALLVDGPRAAAPHARRALDAVAPLGLPALHGMAENALACSLGAAGDTTAMEELLDAALRHAHGDADVAAWGSMVRAIVALTGHDLPRAAAHADAGAAHLLHHDAAPPRHHFGLWALLRTATGDPSARDRIRQHPAGRQPVNRAALGYAEALEAGRAGRAEEAATLFAAADAAMGGHRWWQRLVRLVALEGAVVDGWGDPVPMLRADLEHHERAGAEGPARTCRDLLRRAGRPARRTRGTSPVPPALRALGVTSREMEVLELVVQGLTNAQVAQRLFLSTRTVDSHVASLLAKTGTARRAELRGIH
jgi:DNA-binding CsgD family transcriptional regulator